MAVSDVALELRDVSVAYRSRSLGRDVEALAGFSLRIAPGELVTVVGPSGCGKTTLLDAVAGLIPVTAGQVLVDGRAVEGPGRDRARVFQAPVLMPWRTAAQNVAYGLELQGQPRDEIRDRVRYCVELVDLEGFEDSYPSELSGGMQQRVNLARALAIEPSIVLLDEPLASLDALTREVMQDELLRIWRTLGSTALFVTHEIAEAIYLGDRVVVLSPRPGRIREVLEVDLPRPRTPSMKRDARFRELELRVWDLLHADLAQAGDRS